MLYIYIVKHIINVCELQEVDQNEIVRRIQFNTYNTVRFRFINKNNRPGT